MSTTALGVELFDGEAALKGYALNRMCFSFNDAANREAFRADEAGFCARYGLTAEQTAAVLAKKNQMIVFLRKYSYF